MANLFKQVVKLKNSFADISNHNADALNEILGEDNFTHDYRIKVCDGMSGRFKQGTRRLDICDDQGVIIEQYDLSTLENIYDNNIQTVTGLSVGDIITKVGEGSSFYEKLSIITAKYSYMNNQQFSDIVNVINTGAISDKSTFIKMLGTAAGSNGDLSIHAWMTIVNEFFTNVYNKMDSDSSVELDDSNPYKNSNIISVIFEAISAVLNVVLLVLKGVLQVVMVIISIIIKFFTAVNNSIKNKTKTSFNPAVNNLFVAGPILSAEVRDEDTYSFSKDGNTFVYDPESLEFKVPKDRKIWYNEDNGIAVFSWWNDDYTKTNCNAYMYPSIDVRRLNFNYLFTLVKENNNKYLRTQGFLSLQQSSIYCGNPYSLTNNFPHYDETHVPKNNNEIILSLMVGIFLRTYAWHASIFSTDQWSIHQNFDENGHALPNYIYLYDPNANTTTTNHKLYNGLYDRNATGKVLWHFTAFIAAWLQCGALNLDDTYTLDYLETHLTPSGMNYYNEWIQEMAEDLTEYMRDYAILNNSSPMSNIEDQDIYIYNSSDKFWPGCVLPLAGSVIMYSYLNSGNKRFTFNPVYQNGGSGETYPEDVNSIEANCLPSDFGILLPTLIDDTVYLLLAVTAIAITAVAITAAFTSRFISKTMIAKKTVSRNNIGKLRQTFLDHPNDPTAKKDYVDAVYKYNLFGKIFGYGSYDIGNAWFDSGSGGTSESNSLSSTLQEVIAKQQDQKSDVIVGNQSSADEILQKIKSLIQA